MANVKISQLPSWTGSSADLRWFVMNNSGETETFKFSGYTTPIVPADGSNSVRSIYFASNKNSSPYGVLIGGLDTNQILSTGNYNTIIGGEGSTITAGEDNGIFAAKNSTTDGSSSYSAIIGGRTHTINNQFGFIGGGAQNTAGYLSATIAGFNLNASNQAVVIGGESNTAGGAYSTLLGGLSNTIGGSATHSAIIGSDSSTVNGIQSVIAASQASTIGSVYRGFIGASYDCQINGGVVSSILGGYQNTINVAGYGFISNGYNNKLNGGNFSQILNGQNNTVTSTSTTNVTIIGGDGNTVNRGANTSIISSKNSSQNSGGTYNTDTVVMIGCENTDITNSNNSVVLGLSGRTIVGGSGSVNTTYVDKLVIFGNTTYEATTFNNSGTCIIDIFNMSHVIINATGGTYTLVINPTPSQEGTPELTLLINVSGGATIVFDGSGNTQWKWGNGAGAPSFTDNTKSIIKMSAWLGNDLWEISRSMNMS